VSADLFRFDDLLDGEARTVRDRVRAFCEREVVPVANRHWEQAAFPFELVPKLAALGVCGGTIAGHGCPGLSPLAAGQVSLELARGDGSLSTFFGSQSGLVMGAIDLLGSDEQRALWLPRLAAFEAIGAFALTEPDHGSDAILLETRARRRGDRYVLDGQKRWIGNGMFADVLVVWARDDDGAVGGFLVERGAPGMESRLIEGKASQRAAWQAAVALRGVRVPASSRLPGGRSFRDTARVLTATRVGAAWAALGHATACYEAALAYAGTRHSFGKPLAAYQLVQEKLARMLAELVTMQLLCWRLSQLAAAGQLTDGMAALAKMNNAAKARRIAADARDLLGGNGILLEHHVARHQADLEALSTYEGTDAVQALLVGQEITGVSAMM
jgi:glutaryl-CoA dehydrogenase